MQWRGIEYCQRYMSSPLAFKIWSTNPNVLEIDPENFTRIANNELTALEEKAARVDQLLEKNAQFYSELKELQDSKSHWEAVEKENEQLAEAFSNLEKTIQQKNVRDAVDAEANKRERNTTPVSSDSSVFGKIRDGEYDVVKYNRLVEKYNKVCAAHNETVPSKRTLEETLRRKRAEHDKNLETLAKHIADRDDAIQKKRETIRKLRAQLGAAPRGVLEELDNEPLNPPVALQKLGGGNFISPTKQASVQIPVSPLKSVVTGGESGSIGHRSNNTTTASRVPSPPTSKVVGKEDRQSRGQSQELPNLLGEGRFHVPDIQFVPLEPLPSSSSTEDALSPILPRLAPQVAAEPSCEIPDSPDSPVVVSSRSVRKRKRLGEEAVLTPAVKVKFEHTTSSPIVVRRLVHSESFDLDEIGEKIDTPKKRRQQEIIRQASRLSSESQDSPTIGRGVSHTLANTTSLQRAAPVHQVQDNHHQAASPLQPRDNNQRILPRTSKNLTPRPSRLASDHAIGGLSEDGALHANSENAQRDLDTSARLVDLLAKPSPPKVPLSPARRPVGNQSGNTTRPTPTLSVDRAEISPPLPSKALPIKARNLRNSLEPSKTTKATPGFTTPLRPSCVGMVKSNTHPFSTIKPELPNNPRVPNPLIARQSNTTTLMSRVRQPTESTPSINPPTSKRPRTSIKNQRNMRPEDEMNPENEPLRIRPIETLTIGDFKVNPNANQGIAYAFKDVVRGREQRRCLQGCVKPECCGNELRSLVLMMRDNPRRDQDVEDQKLLEEFMGDNAYKIRTMTLREREEAIIQAMTRDLANKYGRHRHAYQRRQSPPGFWDTDFPCTQEEMEQRRMEHERKQEDIRARYEEAMRPGGAYIFRDEH
jgi:hypothetical protein